MSCPFLIQSLLLALIFQLLLFWRYFLEEVDWFGRREHWSIKLWLDLKRIIIFVNQFFQSCLRFLNYFFFKIYLLFFKGFCSCANGRPYFLLNQIVNFFNDHFHYLLYRGGDFLMNNGLNLFRQLLLAYMYKLFGLTVLPL